MKFFSFISIAFLFVVSTASAQSKFGPSGGSSGSSDPGRMERSMPNLPPQLHGQLPPGLKGALPESVSWDASIAKAGNNPDGMTVNCFAEDSDNLFIGGDFRAFDTVNSQFVVHYNRKTGVWDGLDGGTNNIVTSLALHDGYLYAAGNFLTAGSSDSVVNHIAVWDGASWHSMNGGMNDHVNSIAFVGDTLYAGGVFTEAGGKTAYYLAFWDGQNWFEAAGGTSSYVYTLFATHDSLFVGGTFNWVGGQTKSTSQPAYGTAMLQNGTWTTFGGGYYASAIAFFNSQLWVGGQYFSLPDNSLTVNQIAYFDGSSWNAISSDTMVGIENGGEVNQFFVTGDTLLVLGVFNSMVGVNASGIAMLHNSIWSEFAGGIYGFGNAAIWFDGSLYIGGQFTKAGQVDAMAIASLSNGVWTPRARMESSSAGWESAEVRAIATTSRYVFIGGNFETIAGQVCNHVAAYDKQLKKWITLGQGVNGEVYSLAVQGNNLIVGGEFQNAGTIPTRNIAECNITTKLWSAMGTGAYRSVTALAVDASGSVYAPVFNPLVGNTYYDYLGQWDGTEWNGYGNGLNSGYIDALAWGGPTLANDSLPTLYAAGSFTKTDDETDVNYVAQLQGGFWGSLNNGLNGDANSIAVSGDSIYFGGTFTQADGQAATYLAVWNGNDWNPIGSGFNNGVYALAADGAGGVYVGGEFTSIAGVSRGDLVQWNGKAFVSVSSGVNNTVSALATDSGALYVGGWFITAGSSRTTSLHFAALDGDGVEGVSAPITVNNLTESIYPNPVINAATVDITLAESGPIKLELFNSIGERVGLLADGPFAQGNQSFSLNSKGLPDGLYFLRLTTGGVVATQSVAIEK